ncbi:helix-turn-helix domain-containing protein [Saccharothrix coeruleofusca]|uniref:helix-turn-helix domain-containing protein n=1 Tax=Saccharothrix coeruleofusca TaxID=33919 RepID=UPI0027DD17D5|nr:helix-turn-helix domain-containing protein [Saccharothrix coeruleofusca]
MQTEGTRMFRVKAVAEMFDVHPATIYRAIRAGELDALKVGGSIRIPASSVEVYREACAQAAYREFVTGSGDPAALDGAGQGGDVTEWRWEHGPLNEAQADGRACVVCGTDFMRTQVAHYPVGCSNSGSQVFACRSHPAGQVCADLTAVTR